MSSLQLQQAALCVGNTNPPDDNTTIYTIIIMTIIIIDNNIIINVQLIKHTYNTYYIYIAYIITHLCDCILLCL